MFTDIEKNCIPERQESRILARARSFRITATMALLLLFFLAAASLSLGALSVSGQAVTLPPDDAFDFNLLPPQSLPGDGSFNLDPEASNTIGPFQFELEGLSEAEGFQLELDGSCASPLGNIGASSDGTGLDQTITIVNPVDAFSSESWCIKAVLSLRRGTDRIDVASLEYVFTVTANDGGSFTTSETVNIGFPETNFEEDELVAVQVSKEEMNELMKENTIVKVGTLQSNQEMIPNEITLGQMVMVQVDANDQITDDFDFTIADISVPSANNSAVGSDMVMQDLVNLGSSTVMFSSTDIPLSVFTSQESINFDLDVVWASSRRLRRLQQNGVKEPTSGTAKFSVSAQLKVPMDYVEKSEVPMESQVFSRASTSFSGTKCLSIVALGIAALSCLL